MGTQAKIKSLVRTFRKKESHHLPSALTRAARRMVVRAGHVLSAAECAPVFPLRVESINGRNVFGSRKDWRARTMRLRAQMKHERRGPMSRKGRITIDVQVRPVLGFDDAVDG